MMRVDPDTDLAADPASVEVEKLPIPVQVRWMSEDGVCSTLEGEVSYRAGDPVLTGTDGEQWTMPADAFARAYEPLPPLSFGEDGAYRKAPLRVWALQLSEPVQLALASGRGQLQGQPGDWLLQYGPRDFGIVAAGIFPRTYRRLSGQL